MVFWTSWMDQPLHRVINMGMGQDSRPTLPCETVASPRKPGHRHESVACFLVKIHCLLMKIPKMGGTIYVSHCNYLEGTPTINKTWFNPELTLCLFAMILGY